MAAANAELKSAQRALAVERAELDAESANVADIQAALEKSETQFRKQSDELGKREKALMALGTQQTIAAGQLAKEQVALQNARSLLEAEQGALEAEATAFAAKEKEFESKRRLFQDQMKNLLSVG